MSQTVAQQLYVAYFGRPADFFGIRNFATEVQRLLPNATDIRDLALAIQNNNAGVLALVNQFGTSQESVDLYGTGNTAGFVNAVYLNVLDRNADVPGLTFWVDQINAGNITRASFSAVLMAAAINNTQSAADQNTVANKIAVAQAFTSAIDTNAEIQAYAGNAAAAAARAILNDVDSTTPPAGFQARVEGTLATLVTNSTASTAPGATIALTNQTDTTNGRTTANNDTIVTSASTLQFADDIDGLAGTDTLRLTITDPDYTATEIANGSKRIEFQTRNVETLSVTARTTLTQNPAPNGTAQAGNPDSAATGNNGDGLNAVNGTFDSATVDTIIIMTNTGRVPGATAGAPNIRDGVTTIQSLSTEVNGSSLTFNDIQQINGLTIQIEDTQSAHNFLFDDEATNATAALNSVTLGLTEARGLTINFGETPAGNSNTVPVSTPFSNASNPEVFDTTADTVNNNLVGQVNTGYGLVAASQSDINTLTIDSAVRGPSGVREVFRNEVLDLNVGAALRTVNITGAAQLKVGLTFMTEQDVFAANGTTAVVPANIRNSTVNVTQQLPNPDTTGPVVVGPAPYSYGVVPGLGATAEISRTILRDFAFDDQAYSLDSGIRTVNAGSHFAGVNQAAGGYIGLPVADLTLDLSNGARDAEDLDGVVGSETFNYTGSQGEDSINFGVRTINKNINTGAGNDTVVAGRGSDVIRTGEGNDVIKHNNVNNIVDAAGHGFSAGNAVTVYAGAGDDRAVVAGQTAANLISIVDLGAGNDTLYVEDSADGDLNDGNDTGVANNRLAGGLGADTIIVTTAGNRLPTDTQLDLVIYGDAAVTGEHLATDLVQPAARGVRGEEAARAARVVNANFVADTYFANAALAGAATGDTESDSVFVNDINNTYANLGNGNNTFIQRALNGNGVLDATELAAAGVPLTASDVTVEAGSGIDTVAIYTDGVKQVNTREGNDIVDLVGTGNVTVLVGAGDDRVTLSSVSTAPIANAPANYIDLGIGDDTLTITTKGVFNGVTEVYGREGRDVVSIINANTAIDTDHTLYVELGAGADVMLMRARDLKNDDTISGANDGSIDTLVLFSDGAGTPRVDVSFSDSSRVEGFELIDLRGFGVATDPAATIDALRTLPTTGVNFTLTENLIARMDQSVTVGQVTQYVYGSALPADGAPQGTDGNSDGLFTAGVLGTLNTAATTGVITVTTVESGVLSDNNNVVNPHNAATLTNTLDLRALGDVLNSPTATVSADRSFVNFLGGMARDVVVVDERSFNSFSNLRFDEFDFAVNAFTAANRNVDEDNSSQDTLYVVANTSRNESTDISIGDYRNVQGLDVIALVDESTAVNSTFRVEASAFLASQATSSLIATVANAAGRAEDGVLVALDGANDTVVVYGAAGATATFSNGAFTLSAGATLNDFATVDGSVDLIGVDANNFLIAVNTTI